MLTQTAYATEHDVALPRALRDYGGQVRLRLSGPASAPLVVALGGISADRFVSDRDDGAPGWWPGLVGAGSAIDPARYRILGLDFAADPTGRRAPSTDEQAEVLAAALDAIGAAQADAIVGASYGGMVALALAVRRPERVRRLVLISAPAAPHPASSAVREIQRRTVALGLAGGMGEEALSIARGLAMLTYRTPKEFAERFDGGSAEVDTLATSDAGHYLRARGDAYRAGDDARSASSACRPRSTATPSTPGRSRIRHWSSARSPTSSFRPTSCVRWPRRCRTRACICSTAFTAMTCSSRKRRGSAR